LTITLIAHGRNASPLWKYRHDSYENSPSIQREITSVELLAVISTIIVHVALLLPAVQTVFETTRCAT
jgi:hypothetical protein